MQVNAGDCATPGCTETQFGGSAYDHLGCARDWCIVHSPELAGVRDRIEALLTQVNGLDRLTHFAAWADEATNRGIRLTMVAQGAALIQLIQRERVLTGADVVRK